MRNKQEEFEKLFSDSKNKLYSVAYSVVHSREMAEDVLQDAYIKAWTKFDDYDPQKKFVNWMTTIVRNAGIDAKRSNNRQVVSVSLDNTVQNAHMTATRDIVDLSQDLDRHIQAKELCGELFRLIELLPEDLRKVILLIADQKSYSEISEITNESIGTVRSRVYRAKNLLKNSLEAKQLMSF